MGTKSMCGFVSAGAAGRPEEAGDAISTQERASVSTTLTNTRCHRPFKIYDKNR